MSEGALRSTTGGMIVHVFVTGGTRTVELPLNRHVKNARSLLRHERCGVLELQPGHETGIE